MPLIAKNSITGERLDITNSSSPREDWSHGAIVCPFCDSPMAIKAGKIIAPHFAHIKKCTSQYKSHPETPQHIQGKIFVADMVKKHAEEFGYDNFKVAFEYQVTEVKRIIDVAFLLPSGWAIAHEIQLAGVTTEELDERTNDYSSAGIDVVWWLGGRADTPANRDWCLDRFGQCYHISFSSSDNNPPDLCAMSVKCNPQALVGGVIDASLDGWIAFATDIAVWRCFDAWGTLSFKQVIHQCGNARHRNIQGKIGSMNVNREISKSGDLWTRTDAPIKRGVKFVPFDKSANESIRQRAETFTTF